MLTIQKTLIVNFLLAALLISQTNEEHGLEVGSALCHWKEYNAVTETMKDLFQKYFHTNHSKESVQNASIVEIVDMSHVIETLKVLFE